MAGSHPSEEDSRLHLPVVHHTHRNPAGLAVAEEEELVKEDDVRDMNCVVLTGHTLSPP